MSTLYIRPPSKAVADSLQSGMPLYCQYAAVSAGGAVEREGVTAFSELGDIVTKAQRVVLLLAAGDVTLLRVKVPPLSAQKLRAALPNLIEDELMSDPAECVIVPGDLLDGLRTVAVINRAWLERLGKSLLALGARRIVALPSQLCLPQPDDGTVNAVAMEQGDDIEVAVRLAAQEGIGVSIAPDQRETASFEVIQSLCAIVPHAPIALYVPQSRMRDYQDSLRIAPALEERITLHADNWQRWIDSAEKVTLDLMSGLGAAAGPSFDWRPWRWPIGLALGLLAVNAAGLNIDWLRMKREADALRGGMMQTYRNAFPKDNVIVDPLAQLKQKKAAAQRNSGQLAPDDFVALAAVTGEAIASAAPGPTPVAALEYRDRTLTVKLKPGANVPEAQLRSALAARNLSLSGTGSGSWQIRSAK